MPFREMEMKHRIYTDGKGNPSSMRAVWLSSAGVALLLALGCGVANLIYNKDILQVTGLISLLIGVPGYFKERQTRIETKNTDNDKDS